MKHPPGAITSLDKFMCYLGGDKDSVVFYLASRKFKSLREYLVTEQQPFSFPLNRISIFCSARRKGIKIDFSLTDTNVGPFSGYNDWFLFTRRKDAKSYINS